jgi:hypothetical protein
MRSKAWTSGVDDRRGPGTSTLLKKVSSILRYIAVYLIVSLLAALALLVDTWPHYPRSLRSWALLLVIALPVTVLGDWLSDSALSNSLSLAIETRTRGARVSWLRIGYYLALYVLFAICAVAALYWLESPPD